jgi:DNA polymerase (family 10)
MDKARVAAILDEMGTLLALQGENVFRCNAYHNAARALEQLPGDLVQLVAANQLVGVKGIGETMREKITELATTGKLASYEELRAQVPSGLLELLRVPGLGPKKVKALFDELRVDSPAKLKAACQDGRVASLKGFGARMQAKILEGLEFLDRVGKRFHLPDAEAWGQKLLGLMLKQPGVRRGELCGSLRRRRETVADLDILLSAEDAGPIMAAFIAAPGMTQVLAHGPTRSSIMLENGLQADLRVVKDAEFPFALHYFTGSKDHNIAMRSLAQDRGYKLNEYALMGEKGPIPCQDEAELFRALGLDFIPPELREGTGELAAAAAHALPQLVTRADLRGTFHNHTTASDGTATLMEMAAAARDLGLEYLGIGDHSQSLGVANGLTPDRVRKQWTEIDKLNAKYDGFTVLKGTECDILPDGSLDFDDDLLAGFDYVVASVHTHFGQSRAEMTQRILRAVAHPRVTMLGHMTGRLLLKRDSYAVDIDAVLKAAAQAGTIIEINASPWRLDLDWLHVKQARDLGILFAINPDAHSTGELANLRFGIDVARRGWLTAHDVLNTLPRTKVIERLKQGKPFRSSMR